MRILITGGTGFIGQHLVTQLHAQGDHELVLLVRERYGMGNPLPAALDGIRTDLQLVFADLRTFSLTKRAIGEAKPDVIIHLAAFGATDPFLSPELAIRHNVTGTINLLKAAFDQDNSADKLITARTPGELSNLNAYAASKASAWNFAQMFARTRSWPISGAMIFQCFGPGQSARSFVPAAISAAQQQADFPMTSGQQKRDWIYVDDVVQGLIAALTADLAPGESVDLGTGSGTSLVDVAQLVYDLVGSDNGRPRPGLIPDRPGEVAQPLANVTRTQTILNWRPQFNLESGLRQLLKEYQT